MSFGIFSAESPLFVLSSDKPLALQFLAHGPSVSLNGAILTILVSSCCSARFLLIIFSIAGSSTVAGAAPASSVPLSAKVTLLVVPSSYGTASLNRCGPPVRFSFSAVRCRAAPRRLGAGVVLLRGCHLHQWMRLAIADSFWPLVCASVVPVAGGEPWKPLGSFVGRSRSSALSLGQAHIINSLNHC